MRSIHIYNFYRTKYGDELLIDVIELQSIKRSIKRTPIHRVAYYDITFITEGKEEVSINRHKYMVNSGDAICSIPGEVWEWQENTMLNGYVLVFEEEFLLSFFNDPLFLNKLFYLHPERTSSLLHFEEKLFERTINLLIQIKDEINNNTIKDHHILRAMLYEVLILLNRAYTSFDDKQLIDNIKINRHINTFIQNVNADYIVHRDTQYYADKLFITPNYLNKIVNQSLGMSSKQYIQDKVIQEAKRLIEYTTLSISEIAYNLHFSTVSYFVRSFHKHTGFTPREYREQIGKNHEK